MTARTDIFTTTKTHRQASTTTRDCECFINTPTRPRGIRSLKGILHDFSGTLPHETPTRTSRLPSTAVRVRDTQPFRLFFPSTRPPGIHPGEGWEIAMTTTNGWLAEDSDAGWRVSFREKGDRDKFDFRQDEPAQAACWIPTRAAPLCGPPLMLLYRGHVELPRAPASAPDCRLGAASPPRREQLGSVAALCLGRK